MYVQFNAKIINKKTMQKEKGMDVLLASEASNAQSWIVEGGDDEFEFDGSTTSTLSSSGEFHEVRELHEDDFSSEDDMDGEGDHYFEFEPDGWRAMEGARYGDGDGEDII